MHFFFFLFIRYVLALDYGHALCWHIEIQAVTVANIPDHQPKKCQKTRPEKEEGQKISCLYSTSNYYTPAITAGLKFILAHQYHHFLSHRQNSISNTFFLLLLFWGYAGACRGAEAKKALLHLALPQTLTWSRLKVHQRL